VAEAAFGDHQDARAADVEAELEAFDVGEEAVARLLELRGAVAGKVKAAESIAALRAAAEAMLTHVELVDDKKDGGFMLSLRVRGRAFAPALNLPNLSEANVPLPPFLDALFGPIPVESADESRQSSTS
jgi:hypothetical protein